MTGNSRSERRFMSKRPFQRDFQRLETNLSGADLSRHAIQRVSVVLISVGFLGLLYLSTLSSEEPRQSMDLTGAESLSHRYGRVKKPASDHSSMIQSSENMHRSTSFSELAPSPPAALLLSEASSMSSHSAPSPPAALLLSEASSMSSHSSPPYLAKAVSPSPSPQPTPLPPVHQPPPPHKPPPPHRPPPHKPPSPSPPSVQASALDLHWAEHKETNCWWADHGSETEIEAPQGSAAPGIQKLEECKASCLALYPTCHAVLFHKHQPLCYRKGKINLPKCQNDDQLDLYLLEAPSPPLPPIVPPSPPHPPVGRGIAALNKQFRDGGPSNLLTEVGVLMHQWDGQEERDRPYQMCLVNCMCQGSFINGRVSTMVIYQGLRKRPDRQSIPLPFGDRGGVLLHPSFSRVDCLYGIDGGTYRLDNPAHPGCSDNFCDPNHMLDQNGNVYCGFNGAPATAWRTSDMKQLLEAHAKYGPQWHGPGFHSGYNEAIVNSKYHNDHLPHSIAGFFVPKGFPPVTQNLGYGIIIDVVKAHQAFLNEYHVEEDKVPLVAFDPSNWEEPFSAFPH